MECILYKKGYKYQLTETYHIKIDIKPLEHILTHFIDLTINGTLIIRKGYAWDGCSGPTLDDKTNMRAGLIHDSLYQLLREGYLLSHYRDRIDKIFRKVLIEDGMLRARAFLYYHAVKNFALSAASPQNKKQIIKAPKKCS